MSAPDSVQLPLPPSPRVSGGASEGFSTSRHVSSLLILFLSLRVTFTVQTNLTTIYFQGAQGPQTHLFKNSLVVLSTPAVGVNKYRPAVSLSLSSEGTTLSLPT